MNRVESEVPGRTRSYRWLSVTAVVVLGVYIALLNACGRVIPDSAQLLLLGAGGGVLWWLRRPTCALILLMAGVLTLSAKSYVFESVVDALNEVSKYTDSVSFDAEQWRSAKPGHEGGEDPLRLRMVDDLLESERLLAKTREEVLDLLGPPDDYGPRPDAELNYYLGPERGFIRIDSEHLRIRLNDEGCVIEASIWRD